MSARSQLQSKPVADLRSIAESLGIEHKGLQKAKLIDLLVDHSDEILDSIEEETPEVISTSKDDDAPAVVSSGSSDIKKGEVREGILDTLPEGYGFLRCNGYKPSEEDVYVAAGVIKKYRMRKGDLVSGPIRAPRQKEKYPALIEPKTVNGADYTMTTTLSSKDVLVFTFVNAGTPFVEITQKVSTIASLEQESNLLFNLDFNNTGCYNGSGSVVTDLSTNGFNFKISLISLVTEGVVAIVSASINVVKPSLSTVTREPVTISSSTKSADAMEKDNLLVSPTTKVVVAF